MIGLLRKKLFKATNRLIRGKGNIKYSMEKENYKHTDNITLTEHERKILDTLLDVVKIRELDLTLRVAGGWVRDKVTKNIKY